MTVNEMIERLEKLDPDKIVVYAGIDGGWSNVEVVDNDSPTVSVIAAIPEKFRPKGLQYSKAKGLFEWHS